MAPNWLQQGILAMLRHGYTWVELTPISMAFHLMMGHPSNHPTDPAFHVARPPSNLSPPHSRENRPRPAGKWKYQFESLFGSGLVSSLWKRSPLHAFQMKLFEESICFEFPLFSFWDRKRKYRAQKFFQTVDFFHHNLDTKVLPKGHSNRYLQFHLDPSSF